MERKTGLEQTKLFQDSESVTIDKIISDLEKKPWRFKEYKKQNWGIWLHSISPYVGRIKPSFAHWLIQICTKPGDTILDPFCGIGTVPLEADLLGRTALGTELNPYALIVSKAKFHRKNLEDEINWLKNVKLNPDEIELENVSPYIRQFFHDQTLKEILSLKSKIINDHKILLLACLLGISHGHRPQHLSAYTGYIIPYSKAKVPPEVYKPVIPRMIKKVTRMYKDHFSQKTSGEIIKSDTRLLPISDNTIDAIISSPPYYSTIDYVTTNKLRLALLGYNENSRKNIEKDLIQKNKSYLANMKDVGNELYRVLKPNALCVLVLGDYHQGKKTINTAKNVSEIFSKIGFETYRIIDDEIPLKRRTVLKWYGNEEIKKMKRKLDRIVIMRANK